MPRRTNDFQRLIFAIEEALAANDAKLKESSEIEDHTTEDGREVDFVITQQAGPRELKIGVECRDHSRPQTVEWIEQLVTKRNDLKLDPMVAVSSKGFTGNAAKKAKFYGIETWALTKASSTDWKSIIDDIRFVTEVRATISVNHVTILGSSYPPGTGINIRNVIEKVIVYDSENMPIGNMIDMLRESASGNDLHRQMERSAESELTVKVKSMLQFEDGASLVDADGLQIDFTELVFFSTANLMKQRVPIEHANYGNARVGYAKIGVDDTRAAITFIQGPSQDTKVKLVKLPPKRARKSE